jgi:hypothetical protein
MKPSRFTEERIIGILREQEASAATAEVCCKHGISSATFYKWKAKYAPGVWIALFGGGGWRGALGIAQRQIPSRTAA